jgi:hypothetical protein
MHLARILGIFGLFTLAAAAQVPAADSQAGAAPGGAAAQTQGSAARQVTVKPPADRQLPPHPPLPAWAPHVGTYNYTARLKNNSGESDVQMTTSILEAPDAWKIVDTVVTVAGKTTFTALLDRRTLTVRRSSMRRSGMAVEMEFKDGKVEGQYASRAGAHPIHGETEPLLAGSAGNGHILACLPLAEGYRVSYPSFDTINQKSVLMELQVQGSEQVTGPAGTFDAYKVEISSIPARQETTLWVDKATRIPVKAVTQVTGSDPGAMTLTSELVP